LVAEEAAAVLLIMVLLEAEVAEAGGHPVPEGREVKVEMEELVILVAVAVAEVLLLMVVMRQEVLEVSVVMDTQTQYLVQQ
jgi:hypothetical protein